MHDPAERPEFFPVGLAVPQTQLVPVFPQNLKPALRAVMEGRRDMQAAGLRPLNLKGRETVAYAVGKVEQEIRSCGQHVELLTHGGGYLFRPFVLCPARQNLPVERQQCPLALADLGGKVLATVFHVGEKHVLLGNVAVVRRLQNGSKARGGKLVGSYEGAELWPFGWVIHTHRSKSGWLPRVGLFRTVAWAYLIRAYALESAILYTQIHGIPFRLGKYPPGSREEDKAALKTALANLGRDASGIIPQGMEILFEDAPSATQDIPGILVTRCEQGMSKAILGGTLTTQADGKTSTNALGEVHNEVRHDILASDAAQIAATITRQILAPLAYLNCGVSDPALLPWFRFDTRQAEDIQVFADALPKLASVMDIPAAWAHEKLKIPQAEEGEKVLAVKPQAMPEPAALTASAKAEDGPASSGYADQDAIDAMQADDALADAAEALLAPLIAEIENGLTPEELQERLGDLYPQLDETQLADLLARAFFIADLWGRAHART